MLFLTIEGTARLSPGHVCVRSGGAVRELLDFGVAIGNVCFQGDPCFPLHFLEFFWPSGSMTESETDIKINV